MIILWGATGRGKTFYAVRYFWDKGIYEVKMPAQKNGNFYMNGYNGEETLLIDEFNGQISIQELNKLCDGYDRRQDIKFSTTVARHKRVIITSSKNPTHWWPIRTPWIAPPGPPGAHWGLNAYVQHYAPIGELLRRVAEGGGFVWDMSRGEPPEPTQLKPRLPPPPPWIPPWTLPAVVPPADPVHEEMEDQAAIAEEEAAANALVEWLPANGDDTVDLSEEEARIRGDEPPSPEPVGMDL